MDENSKISMVDVTKKPETLRIATAKGIIRLKCETLQAIKEKKIKKGDVFVAAKLAAINAVKKTSDLIFLAHPIPIMEINVFLEVDETQSLVRSIVKVKSVGKTGVELEAIMGVMAALLTIFDMCKYIEKNEKGQYEVTNISDIRVVEKIKMKVMDE